MLGRRAAPEQIAVFGFRRVIKVPRHRSTAGPQPSSGSVRHSRVFAFGVQPHAKYLTASQQGGTATPKPSLPSHMDRVLCCQAFSDRVLRDARHGNTGLLGRWCSRVAVLRGGNRAARLDSQAMLRHMNTAEPVSVLPMRVTNAHGQSYTVTRIHRPMSLWIRGVCGIVRRDGVWYPIKRH